MPSLLHSNRPLRPLALCCGAVLLTTVATFFPLAAASKAPAKGQSRSNEVGKKANAIPFSAKPDKVVPANSTADGDEAEEEFSLPPTGGDSQRIRLNYLRSTWKKVLTDVAKSMDKDLVADELPAKAYSRLDRTQHSPEEALRILNRDLAAFGQKLVVKGDYLVVISVKQQRMDYSPAVIRGEHYEQQRRDAEAYYAEQERARAEEEQSRPVAAKRRRAPAREQAEWIPEEEEEVEAPRRLPARSQRGVRTASADEEDEPVAKPAKRPAKPYADEPAVEEAAETEIRLKNRDVRSVERIMLKAFKNQTQKLSRGPGDLEGFAVYTPADDSGAARRLRFKIGIDEERNSLLVEASPKETQSVQKLVRALDKLPPGEDGAVRAVSSKKATTPLAKGLQSELERLALATKMELAQARGAAADDDAEEDGEESPARGGRGAGNNMRAPQASGVVPGLGMPLPQGLQGSLKGEVSIEAVPDLNLFIIRGNEKDVETVMSILKEIEKMSEAAAPQVRMAIVEHLNAESVAGLLTSIYERVAPTRSGRTTGQGQAGASHVAVFPIARPNALMIVAPQADMQAILELLESLDQPTDPKMEFKVFMLKHAVPAQVVEKIEKLYPVGQTGTAGGAAGGAGANNANTTAIALSPRVVVVPDARTNSVIIQARPRDMAEVALVIKQLDTTEIESVNQLRIFPLKNATADDLATTMQQALLSVLSPARVNQTQQGQGGAGQFGGGGAGGANQQIQNEDLRDVKSAILEFVDAAGKKERAMRSGLVSDIRISPDARTNSIVVTAPPESIPLIESLIKRLDKPSGAVAEIKVFPLSNADASGMVSLLEGLFSNQNQRQRQGGNQALGGGLLLAGTDDPSSTLIPLKFSVDTRTNSIIAIGGAEALQVVHAVLLSLDASDVRQRQNRVYALRNSPAADVANAIQQFLNSRRQIDQQDPALTSAFDQFDREVVVVPEPVGNKLLISATPRYFNDIIQMVQELDQVPKQVVIQALLVEVELSSNDEWGVELGLQDKLLFSRSAITELVQVPITNTSPNGVATTTQTIVSQSSTPGYNFNNQPLGNNTSPTINASRLASQGLTSLGVGRINSDLGYGGLVLAAGSESVNVLLRALAVRRRIDVLSRPQIQALDNQLATIQVGQEVPRVNSFTINQQTGNATPLVQPRNVGIILEVIPRISPEGMVVMEVAARKDALNPKGIPLFTNPDGSTVSSPIIDTTNAQTSVIVRTGQTIVLGGMITSTNTSEERKVPLLGDIPFLGQLFRQDTKTTRRTELLIFLTPRIIRNEEEAEMVKEIETQRINFIECEAESVHGPLFGVPEEFTGFPTSTGLSTGGTSYGMPPAAGSYQPSNPSQPTRRGAPMIPPPPEPDDLINDGEIRAPRPRPGAKRSGNELKPKFETKVTLAEAPEVSLEDVEEFADYEITPVAKSPKRLKVVASDDEMEEVVPKSKARRSVR